MGHFFWTIDYKLEILKYISYFCRYFFFSQTVNVTANWGSMSGHKSSVSWARNPSSSRSRRAILTNLPFREMARVSSCSIQPTKRAKTADKICKTKNWNNICCYGGGEYAVSSPKCLDFELPSTSDKFFVKNPTAATHRKSHHRHHPWSQIESSLSS